MAREALESGEPLDELIKLVHQESTNHSKAILELLNYLKKVSKNYLKIISKKDKGNLNEID